MKIKFRALCLVMALAAFASAAWAADPTTFVYSNSTGQLGFLAVGESSVTANDPITITKFADDAAGTKIKVFTSSDTIAYAGANNLVYLIVESADGSPAVSGDKIATKSDIGQVVGYGLSNDTAVFIGKSGLSFDCGGKHGEASPDIIGTACITSDDHTIFIAAQKDKLNGYFTAFPVAASADMVFTNDGNISVTGLVNMDKKAYVALNAGVYQIKATSDDITDGPKFVLDPIFPKTNIYKAIAVDNIPTIKKLYILGADNKLYSYAEKTSSSIQPVSTDLSSSETITVATTKVSLDMQAFDGYITVIDDSGLRVYKDDGTAIKLVGKAVEGVVSIAKLATTKATFDGSGSDGDGDSESDANNGAAVDATALTEGQKANLKEATGGDAADFVAPADVTVETGTTPDETVTANVISAAGTGFENATVAAFKNYTLKNAGYLLVKLVVQNAANVKIFLVPVSSSSTSAVVAADTISEGVLLDSDCEITSGSSTYGASTESLSAGTYTLVTATKSSSDDGDDSSSGSTGSSSSGCDAGFGLMSLAALLAVTTISKRR